MPRWQALELVLLAAGSIEHQRSEISGVRSREAPGRIHRQRLNEKQLQTLEGLVAD